MAKIKGITIDLGLETNNFKQGMSHINSEANKLKKELEQVNTALKYDPKNIELIKQKQDLFKMAISETEEAIRQMRIAQDKADKEMSDGAEVNQEQYRRLQREISTAEQRLKGLKTQSTNFEKSSSGIKNTVANIAKLESTANKAAKAVGLIVGGLTAAYAGSQEFNLDMSKFEQNTKNSGDNIAQATSQLKQMYALTGELDSSIEGISNLQIIDFDNANQMTTALNNISGAVISFPDTLKLESMADSLQETIATGKGVGQYSELLERCGISLDDFNAELEQATTTTERQNIALDYLNKTGMAENYEAYKKNNSVLIENKEAQFELQKAVANVGKEVTPVVTGVMNVLSDTLQFATDNKTALLGLATAIGTYIVAVKSATIAQKLMQDGLKVTKAQLVTGVTSALIGTITALHNYAKEQDVQTRAIEKTTESLKQYKEATQAANSQADGEIGVIERKVDRYEQLRTTVNRTAGEERELKIVAKELQAVMPNGVQVINNQTGAYNALSGSIETVIANMRTKAKLDAGYDEFAAAVAREEELQKQIAEAEKKAKSFGDNYENRFSNNAKSGFGLSIGVSSINPARAAYAQADKLKKQLAENTKIITDYEALKTESDQNIADSTLKTGLTIADIQKANSEATIKQKEDEIEEIERLHARGEIDEKEYYDQKHDYLKRHNLLEEKEHDNFVGSYKKYYEGLHSDELKAQEQANEEQLQLQQEQADEQLKLAEESAKQQLKIQEETAEKIQQQLDDTVSKSKSAFDSLKAERDSYAEHLTDNTLYSTETETTTNADGTETKTDNIVLTDFSSKMRELQQYSTMLKGFSSYENSDVLVGEMQKLSVTDAISFMGELKSKGNIQGYIDSLAAYQQQAETVASDMYKDDLKQMQDEFCLSVTNEFNNLAEIAGQAGIDSANAYITNLNKHLQSLQATGFFSDTFTAGKSDGYTDKNSNAEGKQVIINNTQNINVPVGADYNSVKRECQNSLAPNAFNQ